jgi:hypothetical protein
MHGAIIPLSQYTFMAWYLVKQRDNFTFLKLNKTVVKETSHGSESLLKETVKINSSMKPFKTSKHHLCTI